MSNAATRSNCLCCGKRPADSLEHVFPSAIGGRQKVPDVLCKPCNNRLGQTIDAALAKSLDGPRMLLDVEGDRGQTASVVGDAPNLGRVRLDPGAVPTPVPGPPVETDLGGGVRQVRVTSIKEARQYVEALRKKGLTAKITGAEIQSVFPQQVEFHVKLGGDDCFRSAAKTALTFMAWQARDGGLAGRELWRYVDTGVRPASVTANNAFAPKPWPLPLRFERLSHQVTVERNSSGRLRADVRYFGDLAVAIDVDVDEACQEWRLGWACDPFTGKQSESGRAPSPLAAVPTRSTQHAAETRAAIATAIRAILARWYMKSRWTLVRDLWKGISHGTLPERWHAVRSFYFAIRRRDYRRDAPHIEEALRGGAPTKGKP